MIQCHSGPQWHSLCLQGLEVHQSMKHFNNSTAPHSATTSAIVGMKAIYIWPNCLNFLEELGKIASISVWSSMKISNVEDVVNYLFLKGKLPCLVLPQDSCTTLKCRDSSG